MLFYSCSADGDTNEQRILRMNEACQKFPTYYRTKREDLENPLRWLLTDDVYHSIYCPVSKAGSTTWKFILLKVHDSNYVQPKKTVKVHWPGTLRKYGMQYLPSYTPAEAEDRLERYFKYLMVRHPFDRIVSAYRDKMLQPDEECYQQEVLAVVKENVRKDQNDNSTIKFDEFVKFLLVLDPLTMDRHWMPIYYLCQPCYVKFDYIAKVETMDTDGMNIFYNMNASEHEVPVLNTNTKKSERDPIGYLKYFKNVSYEDYQALIKLYERDFALWGYDPPDYSLIAQVVKKAEAAAAAAGH